MNFNCGYIPKTKPLKITFKKSDVFCCLNAYLACDYKGKSGYFSDNAFNLLNEIEKCNIKTLSEVYVTSIQDERFKPEDESHVYRYFLPAEKVFVEDAFL